MKRSHLILLLPVILLLTGFAPLAEQSLPPDYCSLYGVVYVEQVPAFADYKVFKQDIESFADMVVYREDVESYADRPGFWFFTDVKAFADFTIAYEQNEGLADFSLAFTDFRSAAGCQ